MHQRLFVFKNLAFGFIKFLICILFNKKKGPSLDKVDCLVSNWGQWSECKMGKACDDGYQERRRLIKREPKNGGVACPKIKEKRKCFINLCEIQNF